MITRDNREAARLAVYTTAFALACRASDDENDEALAAHARRKADEAASIFDLAHPTIGCLIDRYVPRCVDDTTVIKAKVAEILANRTSPASLTTMSEAEALAERQAPAFKVGQRVRIAKVVDEWDGWFPVMTRQIGKSGCIVTIDTDPDIGPIAEVRRDNEPADDPRGYYFPFAALELVDDTTG